MHKSSEQQCAETQQLQENTAVHKFSNARQYHQVQDSGSAEHSTTQQLHKHSDRRHLHLADLYLLLCRQQECLPHVTGPDWPRDTIPQHPGGCSVAQRVWTLQHVHTVATGCDILGSILCCGADGSVGGGGYTACCGAGGIAGVGVDGVPSCVSNAEAVLKQARSCGKLASSTAPDR